MSLASNNKHSLQTELREQYEKIRQEYIELIADGEDAEASKRIDNAVVTAQQDGKSLNLAASTVLHYKTDANVFKGHNMTEDRRRGTATHDDLKHGSHLYNWGLQSDFEVESRVRGDEE